MFKLNRFVLQVKKHGYSRLYLTNRYYETRARIKCEPVTRLSKDDKLMSRFSGHKYSTDSSRSEKSRGSGGLIAVGALTAGTLGILAYARSSPDFRATLEGWIPGTDRAIQIIFQENDTYFDLIRDFFEQLKQTLLKMIFSDSKDKAIEAPKPAFKPLVEQKAEPVNETYTEIRLSKEKGEEIEVVAEKPEPAEKNVSKELMPQSLLELETYCGETATKAISAFHEATCAVQEYNKYISSVVESTDSAMTNNKIWNSLKEATEKRKKAAQDAEKHAEEAWNSLKRMFNLIDDVKLEASHATKIIAKRNVKKILDDVDEAKKKFEHEVSNANITERYWKKVRAGREYFNEELQILFPNINIHDKKLSINEETFDLFFLYVYNKINHLQKELYKAEAYIDTKLKESLKAVGDDPDNAKIRELICAEVHKEKRILQEAFDKKLLEEQKSFEEEIRNRMKLQAQVHSDHLREALEMKDKEAQRLIQRALNEQAENASIEYKKQAAVLIGRLKGLEESLKERINQEKGACEAQMLWSACQALARAVKVAPPGAPADKAVRPLEPEIIAVSKAAPKEDPLVKAVLEGIPEEAAKRGVFPEDALRERFLKVEKMARKLALVPEEGASLPIYLLSCLQSFLIVQTTNPIPKSELEDAPINVEALNTYDILHRARYYLDRGDFKMALRYMNLLKGASRCIARDWMNETRILLETQQAIDVLLAYAGANGLVFLGDAKCLKKQ